MSQTPKKPDETARKSEDKGKNKTEDENETEHESKSSPDWVGYEPGHEPPYTVTLDCANLGMTNSQHCLHSASGDIGSPLFVKHYRSRPHVVNLLGPDKSKIVAYFPKKHETSSYTSVGLCKPCWQHLKHKGEVKLMEEGGTWNLRLISGVTKCSLAKGILADNVSYLQYYEPSKIGEAGQKSTSG